MESRITGVTAPADERQRNGEEEREKLWWGKKNKSVQQDEDLLVHSRPDPADLPSVPLFSPCSRRSHHQPTSGSPRIHMGRRARGARKPKPHSLLIPSDHTGPEKRHHRRRGDPSLRSTAATTGLITGPKEGQTFAPRMQPCAQDPSLSVCEIF